MHAAGEPRTRTRLTPVGLSILIAVTALAAALRIWGLRFGLPRAMARPDEEAIAAVAFRLIHVGPNPHFFDYPTLFMSVVAAIQKMFGGRAPVDDDLPIMIARWLAAALGTVSVVLVFVLGRRLFSIRAGLVAAALLAVAFLHVRDSHFGVTDTPMTFMVLLAFLAIVALPMDRTHWWNVLIASVLCGLATSTKYNAAVVVVPLAVAIAQAGGPPWAYALAVAGFLGGFLAGTPYALLARREFVDGLTGIGTHLSRGHGADAGRGWVHHLTFTLRYGLGLPFLLASIAGGVWLAIADRRRALLVLSFPVVYYLGMGSGRTVFMRHMLPVIPFAALLAAVFVDRLASLVSRSEWPRASGLAAALLTAVLALDSAVRAVQLDALLSTPDTRTLAAQLVEARYPRGATVYQNGSIYARAQLWPEGIFPQTPLDRRPRVVIVNSSPLVEYRDEAADLESTLRESYRQVAGFAAESHGGPIGHIYDPQDAFYLPVARFGAILRPGPAIAIYERVAP